MRKISEYDDIINLPRPKSRHPRQPIEVRAAQFAPFAALVGFYEKVLKTEKSHLAQVENEIVVEIDEDAQEFGVMDLDIHDQEYSDISVDDEYLGDEF